MELFVGVVDTKLLERVDFERLEAVDVQHPDELVRLGLGRGLQGPVDLDHDPVEQFGVDCFG